MAIILLTLQLDRCPKKGKVTQKRSWTPKILIRCMQAEMKGLDKLEGKYGLFYLKFEKPNDE